MPPEGSPMSPADIEVLKKWIAGGVLDTASSVAKKSTKPKLDLNVAAGTGKPTGPIAKPEHVLLEPVVVTPRTTAVTAMAASPWTSPPPLRHRSRSCCMIPIPANWPASCHIRRAMPGP